MLKCDYWETKLGNAVAKTNHRIDGSMQEGRKLKLFVEVRL